MAAVQSSSDAGSEEEHAGPITLDPANDSGKNDAGDVLLQNKRPDGTDVEIIDSPETPYVATNQTDEMLMEKSKAMYKETWTRMEKLQLQLLQNIR